MAESTGHVVCSLSLAPFIHGFSFQKLVYISQRSYPLPPVANADSFAVSFIFNRPGRTGGYLRVPRGVCSFRPMDVMAIMRLVVSSGKTPIRMVPVLASWAWDVFVGDEIAPVPHVREVVRQRGGTPSVLDLSSGVTPVGLTDSVTQPSLGEGTKNGVRMAVGEHFDSSVSTALWESTGSARHSRVKPDLGPGVRRSPVG